jgi:DEAD/DEAH box helicase domain-containing protein
MIPFTLADEIRTILLDYLTTTFNLQDANLEHALKDFLEQKQGGLYKGPYLQLRLPFRKISHKENIPLSIRPGFLPYVHQFKAFGRLSTQDGHIPQPTLVTTGTGSGKTECFLYPILDYCFKNKGQPGIKAIILYPMNALATDQSARLAEMIHQDSRLRDAVTGGLYIGGEGQKHTAMGESHLIEDRETIRNNPPDILLTNYKMLDFLLLRPEDKRLWSQNDRESLRFLVLDELHTYDGAQGSDVACLIRRLQARLDTPEGYLCPVGTSATVASQQLDTLLELTRFAGEIFSMPFEVDAVITEERVSLAEFSPEQPTSFDLPEEESDLSENPGEPYQTYINRIASAWFGEDSITPISLGQKLLSHHFLHILLNVSNNRIWLLDRLLKDIARWDPDFGEKSPKRQQLVLTSFLALISHARNEDNGLLQPFLTVQVQLWVREMRRLMREVAAKPRFFWRDDIPLNMDPHGLPMYFCRECGHSGWLTLIREGDNFLENDSTKIYSSYFDNHKSIRYVYPGSPSGEVPGLGLRLCPQCLRLSHTPTCEAQDCRVETFPVVVHHELSTPSGVTQPRDLQRCPICGTDNALSIAGAQSASLSSVAISYIYTSPLNQDKRLLAFTDSVQDASHRSAFFGARTYRFNMRTATQAVLKAGQPLSLAEFTDRFFSHWRENWADKPNCDQHLAATFMPPDLRDRGNYREYMDHRPGPIPPSLERELHKRISWEIFMEYGFNERLGRSLEKVGSSTGGFDLTRMESTFRKLALILPEEIGILRNTSYTAIAYFILGFLERSRTRGGIHHPLLQHYIEDQGGWYKLTKNIQPLLSPFHKRSPRFPKFLMDRSRRDVFDTFITTGGQVTWYIDWAQRTLSDALGGHDINDIYRIVVDVLADDGILIKVPASPGIVYAISPEVILIAKDTAGVQCQVCGHKHTVHADQLSHWQGAKCLNYRCQGRYDEDQSFGQRYYRRIYELGQVERIFPHEHTGLLSRKVREAVESGFKTRARADDPNLLTATPTLELGIDIGDLSSTMACSVPPATANYLQRIGRAGRQTGNSLILTLANARPHDLYFFEEPLEMIDGAITPPGCFLDAPNMLKRQLLAYCMDTWTANEEVNLLPHDVRSMLNGLERGGFPLDFISFYKENKVRLFENFIALFGEVISPENQLLIQEFALGLGLANAIREAIQAVKDEREDLQSISREYRRQIKRIEDDPSQYQEPDQEIQNLTQARAIVLGMIKEIEDQYILNFFTDAGLLPNYAFPESGVKFRGIITGIDKRSPTDKGYLVKEYMRPAAQALRELAPENKFYAEERKLPITHVEAPGNQNAAQQWQFCDQCSHMELITAHHHSTICPSCGSEMWSDQGQKKEMILFQQAASWTDHYSSLVGDDSDDREQNFYETGLFFDINPEFSTGGQIISELPFGFEYLNQVTLREINFAKAPYMGQFLKVATEDYPEQGYKVCKGCGLVLPATIKDPDEVAKHHKRNCIFYNKTAEWRNVYLYRTITSEALRILLPVSAILVSKKLTTFETCLELGLRKKFKGNPDHLQIYPHTEPTQDGSRRRYLVVYDTVPGGTSFLRDLAKPDNFREVLELALQTMISCTCRSDPNKHACYRCLYSYRHQRDLALIDRELGIGMINEILGHWSSLQDITTLSDVHIDVLLESELEQRFLDTLQHKAEETTGWSWKDILYEGKRAWELSIDERKWLIEPQAYLGTLFNVEIPSRPDFVFWPQGSNAGVKPIAVFTDGFTYHARPNEYLGGIADDIRKRGSIRASDAFLVWSITWDDVQECEDDIAYRHSLLDSNQSRLLLNALNTINCPLPNIIATQNAVNQLLSYLSKPIIENWQAFSGLYAVALMTPQRPSISLIDLETKKSALLMSDLPPSLSFTEIITQGNYRYGVFQQYRNPIHLLIYKPDEARNISDICEHTHVVIRLDDRMENRNQPDFKIAWRRSLLALNLFQFLPSFDIRSTEQIMHFPNFAIGRRPERVIIEEGENWDGVYDLVAFECVPLLNQCQELGSDLPVVGYELINTDGLVVAMAEFAWEGDKIAVFLPGQDEDVQLFIDHGWQAFFHTQADELLGIISG